MTLESLGWDGNLDRAFQEWAGKRDVQPGRILIEFNYISRVWCAEGEIEAVRSGRLTHRATSRGELPAVGDWVATTPAPHTSHWLIERVLPRRTAVVRRTPGDRRLPSQTLAANVDTVFVVTSANADFNERRLERYLAVAWDSGARPVILLSKSDLVDDPTPFLAAAMALAPTADVVAVSVVTDLPSSAVIVWCMAVLATALHLTSRNGITARNSVGQAGSTVS